MIPVLTIPTIPAKRFVSDMMTLDFDLEAQADPPIWEPYISQMLYTLVQWMVLGLPVYLVKLPGMVVAVYIVKLSENQVQPW